MPSRRRRGRRSTCAPRARSRTSRRSARAASWARTRSPSSGSVRSRKSSSPRRQTRAARSRAPSASAAARRRLSPSRSAATSFETIRCEEVRRVRALPRARRPRAGGATGEDGCRVHTTSVGLPMFRSKAEQKVADAGYDPARLPPGPVPDRQVARAARGHACRAPTSRRGTSASSARSRARSTLTWDELSELPQHRDHARHPLRHALEPLRRELPRRALARAREARAAEAERAASSSRTPSRASPRTCRSRALEDENALLAYEADGEPLDARPRLAAAPRGPAQVLLEERQVAARDRARATGTSPGFWERYGYHNDADYWKEERYGF